jgi:hypothetical protein
MISTTLTRLKRSDSDQRVMLWLGKSPDREAESSRSASSSFVGLVRVRGAYRPFSSTRIQTNISSRKFRLTGAVVGGMRCMSFGS